MQLPDAQAGGGGAAPLQRCLTAEALDIVRTTAGAQWGAGGGAAQVLMQGRVVAGRLTAAAAVPEDQPGQALGTGAGGGNQGAPGGAKATTWTLTGQNA